MKKGIPDAGMNRIAQVGAPDYDQEDVLDRVNKALQELHGVYGENLSEEGTASIKKAYDELWWFANNINKMFN